MLAAGLTAIVGNAWYGQGGRTPPLEGRSASAMCSSAIRCWSISCCSPCPSPGSSWARPASACACAPSAKTRPRSTPRAFPSRACAMPPWSSAGVLCGLGGTYLSVGQSAGFLPNMTAGKGLHRARRADLRQVARLAGARRLLPVRPPRCGGDPAAGHLAARHRRGAGAGDPGAALPHDRDPARGRHRHAPSRRGRRASPT